MAPRKQPPRQPPPVQRLRIKYAKRGAARFSSHRDFSRAFERALRRANVPMAYSSGFNPHPRISFANAAPTSASSEAEYVEIALAQVCDPNEIREFLAAVMPPGLPILQVYEAQPGTSLGDELTAARWSIQFPGVHPVELEQSVQSLLAADAVEIERETKSGTRITDIRPAIVSATVDGDSMIVVTRQDDIPLRPSDVAVAVRKFGDLPSNPLYTRLAQGRWSNGELLEPPIAQNEDSSLPVS